MNKKVYSISEIKSMVFDVLSNTEVNKAILFGSYAKNKQNKDSDIDILLDSNGKIKGLRFYAIIDLLRERLDKEVDVIERSEIDKNSRIEKEIKNTGVIIYEKQR